MQVNPPNDAIVLYDIPSNLSPMAWSPNTWKARFALNFKGIPYRTVWIEYPDIEPTMKAWGVPPAGTAPTPYTLPVISIPNPSGRPKFVGESFEIALELDRLYPERPLFPPGSHALQEMFKTVVYGRVNMNLWLLCVPLVVDHLRPNSVPYWNRTREAFFGPLQEACPVGSEKREGEFKKLKENLDVIDDMLQRNPGGTWVMGDQISFADMVLASEFIWIKRVGSAGDWERVSQWNGGRWKTLVESLGPYMSDDS